MSDLLLLPEIRRRTTCSTTSTTSTFRPYEESQVCSAVRNSAIQAAQAMTALGQAGVRGAVAGRQFSGALQNMQNLARAEGGLLDSERRDLFSNYNIGVVKELIIKDDYGAAIVIENAIVKVEVEQETIDHYSMGRLDQSVVVNEKKVVTITLKEKEALDLTRLIRED